MKHLRLLGAALALLGLAGCAVGPDYVRPSWNLLRRSTRKTASGSWRGQWMPARRGRGGRCMAIAS
ncbi:hypothetical protein [Paludibacterium denitrificans]|uniref:hypothetical protein n=1 Tax=Paludibacterium denitrificans TaxID=2675226 RepID=UPI001E30F053|nr:hypothetical protein [Paludibacterium denitrificans]